MYRRKYDFFMNKDRIIMIVMIIIKIIVEFVTYTLHISRNIQLISFSFNCAKQTFIIEFTHYETST